MARGDNKKGGASRPPRKQPAKPKAPKRQKLAAPDLASLPIGGEIDFTAQRKPPKPAREKVTTRIELDRRIRSIEERLRDGLTEGEIVNELMDDCTTGCPKDCTQHSENRHIRGCPPNCRRHLRMRKRQTAESYIRRAYDRLRQLAKPEEQSHRDQILAMLHRSFQGCMQIGHYGDAANVAMKIARIKGLIDADPNITNVLALLSNLPTDKDRFAGDRNYQLLGMLRDALAQLGARGNVKAASAAMRTAATMAETFGISQGTLAPEEERRIADEVRSRLITQERFGEPIEAIEAFDDEGNRVPAVNDFAAEQVAAKKKSEGER